MKLKIFVAAFIFFCFLSVLFPSGAEENRNEVAVFSVKIAADQYYCEKKNWQEIVKDLIEEANKEFQKQGILIKFETAEITRWEIDGEIETLEEALYHLMEKAPRERHDLVIGLTAKTYDAKDKFCGWHIGSGYIVVKEYYAKSVSRDEKSWILKTLSHEIGHFMGLGHSDDLNSIMHNIIMYSDQVFLEKEIKFINARRWNREQLAQPVKLK